MKKLLAFVGIAAVAIAAIVFWSSRSDAADRVPCTGTVAVHSGDCLDVIYTYADGYVPTGSYDPASFPQNLFSMDGTLPQCGWQRDLVQGDAAVPQTLTDPNWFFNHGWYVDATHAPAGTPVCETVEVTTSTTSTTQVHKNPPQWPPTTRPAEVLAESTVAIPVVLTPRFTG